MQAQRPQTWLRIGAIALIASAVTPLLETVQGDVEAKWDVEKWGEAELAYIVSSLLAPVLGLLALLAFRDLSRPGRAFGLLATTLTVVVMHFICPEPPVFATGDFDGVELNTHGALNLMVVLGVAGVTAGCLAQRSRKDARALVGLGGLWIVLAYLVPHAGGEPVVTAFFVESSWGKVPGMTGPLLLLLVMGVLAAWTLRPRGTVPTAWLLRLAVGAAVLAPTGFVVTIFDRLEKADAWYVVSVVLRTVLLYYGMMVLLVVGLWAWPRPASSPP